LSSIGEPEKVGCVGDYSHVVFDKEFPGEKESVRTVRCDATARSFVAKVRGEVFAHFHVVALKRHSTKLN
jgi:hypothetical protein